MRIAYVCNEYPPVPHGGIGTFTRDIAKGMAEAGHQVTVVGYGSDPGERDDRGIKVVTLPECKIRGIAWVINRRRLHRWLKRRAIDGELDIIETPEFAGLLPFPFHHCPVVVRLHLSGVAINRQAGLSTKFTLRWCETNTLKQHRYWIGVSNYIAELTEQLFEANPQRVSVIYNPVVAVENPVVAPFDPPDRFVLFVGTVGERKGAYILVEACRTVLNERENLHLVYAGAIVNSNGLRSEHRVASILGDQLMRRVHFLGRLDHAAILGWMRRAAVVSLPSRLEAFGLVAVEAMACGTPVIYTAEGVGPEVIEDGVTGLLADPYSAEDVAQKIGRILDNPEYGESLAKNAKSVVRERFSVGKCVDATLSFYESCALDA